MPLDGIQARNDSKGCGGVMRVAPVGLYVAALEATKATKCVTRAFALGVDAAAITHGHPTGQLAAGAFAALIARLVQGATLDQALDETCAELVRHPNHRETLDAVNSARALADSASATPETLARLGQGWIAEEALAIGIFCALVATTLEEGIVLAVNHSGDSDSTGSIAGNLLGAMYGVEAVPQRWTDVLELREVILELSDDLASTSH